MFNDNTKQYIPVYVVASVSEDNYVTVDSCYTDYSKANDRAEVLMEESFPLEWEVLSCKLEN